MKATTMLSPCNVRFLVIAAALTIGSAVTAAELQEVTEFGSNPGNLKSFEFVPDQLPTTAPLVVLLHGCKQDVTTLAEASGWTTLAERWGFVVLLPEQQKANNEWRCFNWFEPEDNRRDQGETASLKQLIDATIERHALDPQRVYVVGLSAGGAMSTVLLASYPEVFAGGAIIAGLPYGCAGDLKSALHCQSPGVDLEPAAWAKRVREALPETYRTPQQWPRISIWHGDQDALVHPVNANELLDQWTALHGIDQQAEIEDTVNGYPHRIYQDAAGKVQVEIYELTGMDHGLPIDPGSNEDQCGSAAPFILPVGLCSSYYIARFWGIAPAPVSALSTSAGEDPNHEHL